MNRLISTILVVLAAAWGLVEERAMAEPAETVVLGWPPGDVPVVVEASFELRDINDIDDAAETFQISGLLELRWRDDRQAFDPEVAGIAEKIYQGDFQFNEISPGWFPQVVLVNESGLFEKHGILLRVDPDGTSTLVQAINATCEADLNVRRYPFDRQTLKAAFEVLGANDTEVLLRAVQHGAYATEGTVSIPQWKLVGMSSSTEDRVGSLGTHSTLVVSMEVERKSFFVVRLVVLPLILIVILSWSVFWMDRSSVADRINISFIGILTSVAYQIVVSDIQPEISYFTLMHGFLNLSLVMMGATVVINLVVGELDKRGKADAGDRIDRYCRKIFPLTYFGLNALMVFIAFTFF